MASGRFPSSLKISSAASTSSASPPEEWSRSWRPSSFSIRSSSIDRPNSLDPVRRLVMRIEPLWLAGKKLRMSCKSTGLSRLSKTNSHRSLHLERVSLTEVTAASGRSNTWSGNSCLAAVSIELYRVLREEASSQNIAWNLLESFIRRQYSRASCVLPAPPIPISTTINGVEVEVEQSNSMWSRTYSFSRPTKWVTRNGGME